MAFVTLTDVNGDSVAVNPDHVISLTPALTADLPTGIAAGTYIGDTVTDQRLCIQGTVAAVAALLAGTASTSLPHAAGASAGGFLAGITPVGIASIVRTGAGVYTVTLLAVLPGGGVAQANGVQGGPAAIAVGDGIAVGGGTFDVNTFDAAGVATDADFTVVVFPA